MYMPLFLENTRTGEYRIHRTNQLNGCDTTFYLYLAVDTLCGKPCKERGVLINGVCWAESNVDNPDTFADTPESFGLLYQWNWKKGHSLHGDIDFADWGYHIADAHWEAANNPCPAGWRIPTLGEIYSLQDDLKVTRERTQQNGVNGMRFTDKLSGSAIFLPEAGVRYDWEILNYGEGTGGYYWSTTREYRSVYLFVFDSRYILIMPWSGNYARSVRCVAGRDTTGCGTIITDTIINICEKELPYEWEGTVYTESGIYEFQYVNATGCDSTVRLHLNVHQPQELSFSDAVCYGSDYHGYGFNLTAVTADTIVSDTLQTPWGCDSIRTLFLSVHPAYNRIFHDTICEGDGYHGYGFHLPEGTTGGTFTETYPTD
ncbi:MAG: fibrobacter succinogenes major paralogous domain-containing protein, partial [Odoribacter sp.]|nr:fibrobacter succinogenes major paralogous domain-containing protein [Odoribacter sp.]